MPHEFTYEGGFQHETIHPNMLYPPHLWRGGESRGYWTGSVGSRKWEWGDPEKAPAAAPAPSDLVTRQGDAIDEWLGSFKEQDDARRHSKVGEMSPAPALGGSRITAGTDTKESRGSAGATEEDDDSSDEDPKARTGNGRGSLAI